MRRRKGAFLWYLKEEEGREAQSTKGRKRSVKGEGV